MSDKNPTLISYRMVQKKILVFFVKIENKEQFKYK